MRFVVGLVALATAVGGCRGTPAPSPSPSPSSSSSSSSSTATAPGGAPGSASVAAIVTRAATGVAAAAAAAPKPSHPEATALRPHHEDPVVECPISPAPGLADDARLAAYLDAANKQLDLAQYGAAWTCADRASDLAPTSVEAHHLRGAALAGLGRDSDAQVAYQLALALDPDDPETLRALADFYINGKGDRGHDAIRLGLELAQRGSRRVHAHRRRPAPAQSALAVDLAVDLAILEAQALNDLGRSDEAVARVDAALRLDPDRGDALHERGVALFDLSRFAESRLAFERALALQPDDPYTHQLYGLALEALGDDGGADRELAKAVALAPEEISAPVVIPEAEFRAEIDHVIAGLPAARAARVRAIRVEIADLPRPDDLAAVTPPFPPTILGLYRGPVGEPDGDAAGTTGDEPPSIVLYRKNLARAVRTRAELSEQIRDTLLHEIGHLEGLDEDDLRRRGME